MKVLLVVQGGWTGVGHKTLVVYGLDVEGSRGE